MVAAHFLRTHLSHTQQSPVLVATRGGEKIEVGTLCTCSGGRFEGEGGCVHCGP